MRIPLAQPILWKKSLRLRVLPSIDLLRTFDATARHLSFNKAAAELFVTPSAVSKQIKLLEEELGIALYLRGVRSLRLTEAGSRLQQTVDVALQQLEATVATLKDTETTRRLGITTTVSFAALWLVPRLAEFRMRHADLDLRVSASSEVQDIKRKRFDLAIRYARHGQIPQGARVLFEEKVFAVCAPGLHLNGALPIREPGDLARHVLLHMDDACGDLAWYRWSNWFEAMGLPAPRQSGALRFSQYDQMIQAAIDGQGVALGRDPLVNRLIAKGSLVAPFGESPLSSGVYYLVTVPGAPPNPDASLFTTWLLDQASTADVPPTK